MRAAAAIVLTASLLLLESLTVRTHDFTKNPVTWNREISRIVYDRCASCHRDGGTAFSLMTYQDARPRVYDIGDAVLSRRMPPWGAVKGFGDFRNDQGLTQEQIELFGAWAEGNAPRGNNPRVHPEPPKFEPQPRYDTPASSVRVAGTLKLARAITLDGVLPQNVPPDASMQVTAVLPDGAITPLVWLYEYRDAYRHPFLFREPIELPAGTVIRGVRPPARILLLPRP